VSLPWVRLDSQIASHDKVLNLLADPSPKRWQAAFSYVSALGYAGAHGTDGAISRVALGFVHGTVTTARLLVTYRLWTEDQDGLGWHVVNYAERQELAIVTAGKREMKRLAAEKANCTRWNHPKDCWSPTHGCSVAREASGQ
jgi:hypothetical protein